jgi:hypothetical protein
MNGPQHYVEAERLLANLTDLDAEEVQAEATVAQVHATLALAAAVVGARRQDPIRAEFGHSDVDRAFYEVTK